MNASHPTRPDDAPDLELLDTSEPFGADNTARVPMNCWDYGGFATVRAIHGSSAPAEMRLPKDDNNNGISDAGWELVEQQWNGQDFVNVWLGHVDDDGGVTDDQDNSPAGAVAGDNLIRFEEYRGFIVGAKHRRTSPGVKDVFLFNNSSASNGDAQQVGLRWHVLSSNEISASRRINSYATGIPGHVDQQGILVFNGPVIDPVGKVGVGAVPCVFQAPYVCYPNIIGSINGAGFETRDIDNNVRIMGSGHSAVSIPEILAG